VKPEQASKVEMRVPIRLYHGEGRCEGTEQPRRAALDSPGYWAQHAVKILLGNVGDPLRAAGRDCQCRESRQSARESERLMVPMKPVTTVEERGLTSGCLTRQPRIRGLA